MTFSLLLAAAMSSLPPRPQPPGPESWTFKEELAAPVEGAAWMPSGEPWLKDRISRCFFGPIKREPYFRDELMDNVDYYPDGYLAKLKRDGINGLWLTVEFHEIAETRFFPRDPNAEKRLAKLRNTVEKCAKYGIKVWIFVLEPKWLKEDHPFRKANPEMFVQRRHHFAMCPSLPQVREYLYSAAHDVFSRVPGLGGIIGITHGEDITSCFSYGGRACPRCEKLPRWKQHFDLVEPMAKGARAANPDARFISWFYQPEAQTTRPQWVYDCAEHLPQGVRLMYNFESGVLAKQCDRWRVGGDYWLSKPGPGAPFEKFSAIALKTGNSLAAKIQMACSHEMASVPYVPVPGLLYRKFKAMRECGVDSAMLSWYFGNYPCVMSRAAGRLAYDDFSGGEKNFLLSLAAEDWGAEAPAIAALWKAYSDAYGAYPLSNYMQYYGPYHCGTVWALYPQVEMRALEPTWMPHFDPAGDAIGECLRDFTLDEALSLACEVAKMPEPTVVATNRAQKLDLGVMKAVRRQCISARNIFEFYRSRSEAIYQSRVLKNSKAARRRVARMRALVSEEARISREMIELCKEDSRLGFHSEAEAHQYFPARLEWRIDALSRAEKDLAHIDQVLSGDGEYPQSDYEKTAVSLQYDQDEWANGEGGFKVRAYRLKPGGIQIEAIVPSSNDAVNILFYDTAAAAFPLTYRLDRTGEISSPVWNGEERSASPATLSVDEVEGGWSLTLIVPESVWGGTDRLRPQWMLCHTDDWKALWPIAKKQYPRRLWHVLNPRQFGRLDDSPSPYAAYRKPFEPSARIAGTNTWYGQRMALKRKEIAGSNGKFDLVFVGDSITHFWERGTLFSTDGSSELEELKKKYSILNLGFAGDSTEHVLWRLQNGQADGYTAKAMMLMIGTNNMSGPVEDVAKGIEAIIKLWREKQPDSTIVLMSVIPRDVIPGENARRRMERLNALIDRFADGIRVLRVDLTDKFLTADGFLNLKLFCRDQVHLNERGYRIWREAVAPVFDSIAGDTRPYEFIDAGRTQDEVAPWIDFEGGVNWRAEPAEKATALSSSDMMLFGKKTLKVSYANAGEVRIRPNEPLPLPAEHEWFGVWIRNDPSQGRTGKGQKTAPSIELVFSGQGGREVRLPLRNYYGTSKLNWPDWWYAVRKFSSAEMKVLNEPGLCFDGFLLSGCSNSAPCTVYFDNIAFFCRDMKKTLEVSQVPQPPIPTRKEGALPTSGKVGFVNEVSEVDGTKYLRYKGSDGTLEYIWRGSPETLEASWNGGKAFRPWAGGGSTGAQERVSFKVSIAAKTLIVDVAAPAGVETVSMGHVSGAKELSRTYVPSMGDGYWWDNNRSQVTAIDTGSAKLFVLAFPDWYVSSASAMEGLKQANGSFDRSCVYRMKSDGTFNPVSERVYVTVSPDFMETLPEIANPPSPWKHITGRKAWCRYSSGPNRSEDRRFLSWLHRHGIRELVINEHECCMRDDGESFTFRAKSAPRKGGDEAWRNYASYVINTLGYYYGPYNNYTDLAPVNANWSLDRVCLKSPSPDVPDSGGLMPAWTRCYAPKAAFAYASSVRYAHELKRRYGFNTAYCDVHTAILPWEYVDCDARVPQGGMFKPFYEAYAAILLEQKKAWQGPVYSEGNSHFFYAGLADGNYGQLGIRTDKDPWIVDFDLKRLHPLQSDFGVGNLSMFLPGLTRDSSSKELEGAVDRFLAATLAFGHTPFLILDMMRQRRCDTGGGYPADGNATTPEIGLPYALRSYFMVQPAAALYSQAEIKDILYYFDGGHWKRLSEAVLSGDRQLQRIALRFGDGTCVVANGHINKRLRGEVFSRKVDLPPCGYVVWNQAAKLDVESSDRHGVRMDYSASQSVCYLDTRTAAKPVSFERARGKGLAVCRREGEKWEIIPVRGVVAFKISGTKARALDEKGDDIGAAQVVRDAEGFAQIVPVAGAFSYLVY